MSLYYAIINKGQIPREYQLVWGNRQARFGSQKNHRKNSIQTSKISIDIGLCLHPRRDSSVHDCEPDLLRAQSITPYESLGTDTSRAGRSLQTFPQGDGFERKWSIDAGTERFWSSGCTEP